MGECIAALACPGKRKGRLSTEVSKGKREEQRGYSPFFEFLAMGIIFYAANHEVGQVAVLMCYRVDETVLRSCQLAFIMVRLGLS